MKTFISLLIGGLLSVGTILGGQTLRAGDVVFQKSHSMKFVDKARVDWLGWIARDLGGADETAIRKIFCKADKDANNHDADTLYCDFEVLEIGTKDAYIDQASAVKFVRAIK